MARALTIMLLVTGAFCGLIAGLVVAQGQRDETRSADAAVVLGAAQWNGDPSPVLQARLDHARDLYRQQVVRRIILTGGVGTGDTVSEAAAGREYLLRQGVPLEALILEEQGRTTYASLRTVSNLMQANNISSVLLVSDPFHMLRSLKMAHDLGMDAYGSPTRTSPIAANRTVEARLVLRETWAYLSYMLVQTD